MALLNSPTKTRLSTNEKLNRILNGRDDDEEDEEGKRARHVRVKQRLSRSVLYGSGVRGHLPAVKKKNKPIKSQFMLTANQDRPSSPLETTTVPPGAHADQYRMVSHTTLSHKVDPDRMVYTSGSMTGKPPHISQPPWYVGNLNKVNPPDNSIITSASRYGFRGSKNIRQYQIQPYMSPIRTKTEHTPKFLNTDPLIDEWVPPLSGSPLNKGYQLTTPKLWPENSEFVTGYPKKTHPTSSVYNKETTVAVDTRPSTTKSMDQIQYMFEDEESILQGNSNMEMTRCMLSRPMSEQMIFRSQWDEHLSKTMNASLMSMTGQIHSPSKLKSKPVLMDSTDTLRYSQSGGTSVIVHSHSSDLLKYRDRIEQSKTLVPYTLRWTQMFLLVHAIRSRLRRDQTLGDVIRDISMKLHVDSMGAMREQDVLIRPKFLQTMSSIDHLSQVSITQINTVYSAFDYFQSNAVRLVDVICAFMVLDYIPSSRPNESTVLKKLTSLWYLYDTFAHKYAPLEKCQVILCACAGSDDDRQIITRLFKEKFRPRCVSLSAMKEPILGEEKGKSASMRNTLNSHGNKSQSLDKNTQFAYNICDSHLDCEMFMDVLAECQELVEEFDRQWRCRLADCFGGESS